VAELCPGEGSPPWAGTVASGRVGCSSKADGQTRPRGPRHPIVGYPPSEFAGFFYFFMGFGFLYFMWFFFWFFFFKRILRLNIHAVAGPRMLGPNFRGPGCGARGFGGGPPSGDHQRLGRGILRDPHPFSPIRSGRTQAAEAASCRWVYGGAPASWPSRRRAGRAREGKPGQTLPRPAALVHGMPISGWCGAGGSQAGNSRRATSSPGAGRGHASHPGRQRPLEAGRSKHGVATGGGSGFGLPSHLPGRGTNHETVLPSTRP